MKLNVFFLLVMAIIAGGLFYLFLNNKSQPIGSLLNSPVVLPIEDYQNRRTLNAFGEYSQFSLNGYHTGDDVEYADTKDKVKVLSIANGIIMYKGVASGYGGVMMVSHTIEGKKINSLYGHIDISSSNLNEGDSVAKGQYLANLGEDKSEETGGERKHLHFTLYQGEELILKGYETDKEKLPSFINPTDFFSSYGINMQTPSRIFNPEVDIGGKVFFIEFLIPEGWEAEYIKEIRALNLYPLHGEGSARDRSKVLITYFDADRFLTLDTVNIHTIDDLAVGQESYVGKRYDIEKKQEAKEFKEQPLWRNSRHIAVDFRKSSGYGRYYSIAVNPNLDLNLYQAILKSVKILNSK